ncbi:hypothetical protein [Herbaspirillum sp. YR522]|uniref:hypothetical protein n=1 Tax=Herbaspirillum sp. YR522 TaxID=1144342 RepID=UPI00026FA27B|nr:hypothetical protein [Herbaspirillum sp. YR522]EJN07888.1 hypothetical protein PMI40_01641 [Herbaspirillum sp. YR522]
MTKFYVSYKQESQPAMVELALEVDEPALSCDIVMRALARHLDPSVEWPFAVNPVDCPADADLGERAARLSRSLAERRYLKLAYVTYRPAGTVLEFTC